MKVFPFSIFKISGHSMEPFLREGNLVVVWRWGEVGVEDVVVFRMGKEIWVKRVKEIKETRDKKQDTNGTKLIVEGDNKSDSHQVEPIPKERILGKVVLVLRV